MFLYLLLVNNLTTKFPGRRLNDKCCDTSFMGVFAFHCLYFLGLVDYSYLSHIIYII